MEKSSEEFREEGNALFTKLKNEPNTASVAHRRRFTDTLQCYNRALGAATNDDQHASAYLEYYLRESISAFGRAFQYGKRCKSAEWSSFLHRQIEEFLDNCYANCTVLLPERRWKIFSFVTNGFEQTMFKKLDSLANIYYELGQLTFQKAVRDFKKQPRLIYECQPYIERALYWAKKPDRFRKEEVKELRADIWLHQCMHESANARRTGQKMLDDHLRNDENLEMDIVWAVIDKLREAILLAREHDIKGEARAYHQTAVVYEKVLKMTELAYNNHLRCVTLAQTLVPRNLTSFPWYQKSFAFVEKYRAQSSLEEEKLNRTKNEQYRKELKEVLFQLDQMAQKDTKDFLQHIYSTHPPKNAKATLGSVRSNKLKEALKKAILHYHPDAQTSLNDPKWTFLCSEITKILSDKYSALKIA